MIPAIEERLQRNRDFLEGKELKRPLTVVRLGGVFHSTAFNATKPLISKGHIVTPDQIDVDAYLADYERMYQEICQVDMDGIFSADPCTGFPWMEGFLGAQVVGSEVSFVSHPTMETEDLENLAFDPNNPWALKYLEFVEKLTDLSNGRFPVGQPIMRGVTDTVGSLIGQMDMIYAIMEEPELTKKAFDVVADTQRYIMEEHYKRIQPFHGGYVCGLYHVWGPGKFMWYQEDLCALLSPQQYDDFIYDATCKRLAGYDYSLVHLHPASFFSLDSMLKVKDLDIVQINKDVGGPTVREMIPQFLKVLEAGKKVQIGFAKLNQDDIDAVFDCLPSSNVSLHIVADNVKEAQQIMEYVNSRSR